MKIPTYEEYKEKVASLETPEDVAEFVKDLVSPAMAGNGEGVEIQGPSPEEKKKAFRKALKSDPLKIAIRRYEVASNDTEERVIALYAKGLTTRDISNYLREVDGIEIAQSEISSITDKVYPLIKEWQSRPLSSVYPFVYLDGLHFKVRDGGKIVSKCAYIVLGVNTQGHKEVMGIWIGGTEGAKFWMQVLNEIKNRGVDDILIVSIDGLRGFSEAIKAIYPNAEIQQCIVHQIRHTVKFLPIKDREKFCKGLKEVYGAPTEESGRKALEEMKEKWSQYRMFLKSWEDKWSELSPLFEYPEEIRRAMYATNPIENLNRQFRKVTKTTNVFPHNESLEKLLWLAQDDVSRKWDRPVWHWGEILAQLTVLFPDRIEF